MKRSIFIGMLLCFAVSAFAQKRPLEKASQYYEAGNYPAALKQLDKADKDDYGFCGNAYWAAYDQITKLRARTYIAMEEYPKARNALDAGNGYLGRFHDDVRAESYQKEFGKAYLEAKIDEALTQTTFLAGSPAMAIIPLDSGNIKLEFPLCSHFSGQFLGWDTPLPLEKQRAIFIEMFKRNPAYYTLKGLPIDDLMTWQNWK